MNMGTILDWMNHPFFLVIGSVLLIITIVHSFLMIFWVIKGILPILCKLGLGLSKRRIAVFSTTDYASLKDLIVDSGVFKQNNIIQIHLDAIKKAEKESIFLVHWKDYKDKIDEILAIKSNSTALIVYAPQDEERLKEDEIKKLNGVRNTIIVNFRGRLLNDIFVSMITTSF